MRDVEGLNTEVGAAKTEVQAQHPCIPLTLTTECTYLTRHFLQNVRIVCIWNSLLPSTVDFRSLPSFKKTISHVRVNLFTRYRALVCVFVTCIVRALSELFGF